MPSGMGTATGGARVLIEFEGMWQAGAVYLNGGFVGLHEAGVTAFG
jgi:beta-galactosidase